MPGKIEEKEEERDEDERKKKKRQKIAPYDNRTLIVDLKNFIKIREEKRKVKKKNKLNLGRRYMDS